jgi:hypothetical protein
VTQRGDRRAGRRAVERTGVRDAVEEPAPARETRLASLLADFTADDRASYKRFGSAAELRELVADDLTVLLTERFSARSSAQRVSTLPTAYCLDALALIALVMGDAAFRLEDQSR